MYLSAELTDADAAELAGWIAEDARHREIFEKIVHVGNLAAAGGELQRFETSKAALLVKKKLFINNNTAAMKPAWRKRVLAIAAAVALLIGGGATFVWLQRHNSEQQVASHQPADIPPGRDQAVLTLANGQQVVLHKGLNGNIARQGSTTVGVNGGEALTYTATGSGDPETYNTLTTARGEQSPFPLVLADGTKVWLNTASSITFPTAFTGKERKVTIAGEAYFEIAHNSRMPFRVVAGKQTIEDIGTRFNVNCYSDEPAIRTTLIEGAVGIRAAGREAVVLAPGQQAVQDRSDNIAVHTVDAQQAVAWKEGLFKFREEDLGTIMRMVSRWYNVEVEFSDPALKELRFGAVANRFANISTLLHMLELTDEVRFKLKKNKVIVLRH
jgi:ferric-dicitrate binding protein FerR (iron transport regulator)